MALQDTLNVLQSVYGNQSQFPVRNRLNYQSTSPILNYDPYGFNQFGVNQPGVVIRPAIPVAPPGSTDASPKVIPFPVKGTVTDAGMVGRNVDLSKPVPDLTEGQKVEGNIVVGEDAPTRPWERFWAGLSDWVDPSQDRDKRGGVWVEDPEVPSSKGMYVKVDPKTGYGGEVTYKQPEVPPEVATGPDSETIKQDSLPEQLDDITDWQRRNYYGTRDIIQDRNRLMLQDAVSKLQTLGPMINSLVEDAMLRKQMSAADIQARYKQAAQTRLAQAQAMNLYQTAANDYVRATTATSRRFG